MLFHSVTEEDVKRRNCLAKSCPYCVRNSLLEDQNHSIVNKIGLFLLGRKQSGESIDSVELPVWAKGCPQEFIRYLLELSVFILFEYPSTVVHHLKCYVAFRSTRAMCTSVRGSTTSVNPCFVTITF